MQEIANRRSSLRTLVLGSSSNASNTRSPSRALRISREQPTRSTQTCKYSQYPEDAKQPEELRDDLDDKHD